MFLCAVKAFPVGRCCHGFKPSYGATIEGLAPNLWSHVEVWRHTVERLTQVTLNTHCHGFQVSIVLTENAYVFNTQFVDGC